MTSNAFWICFGEDPQLQRVRLSGPLLPKPSQHLVEVSYKTFLAIYALLQPVPVKVSDVGYEMPSKSLCRASPITYLLYTCFLLIFVHMATAHEKFGRELHSKRDN